MFGGLIMILLAVFVVDVSAQVCGYGWFGSKCQYRCRCKQFSCNKDGECLPGVGCERDWFGPACQYRNLASEMSITDSWGTNRDYSQLMDEDVSTCITVPAHDQLIMSWTTSFPFTWMRLHVTNSSDQQLLNVKLGHDRNIVPCSGQTLAYLSNTSVDVHCERMTVSRIYISGYFLPSICTIYVSGGRNVALKQETRQSSNLEHVTGSRAVDGLTSGFWADDTCSHTGLNDLLPTWNLWFSQPQILQSFIIYNRLDCCSDRLNGFTLETFNGYSLTATIKKKGDFSNTRTISGELTSTVPVTKVTISVRAILTLCEVELYGDSTCDLGKYGRDCSQTCNCASGRACYVSTGACPSGCTAGFYGFNCGKACSSDYYGANCTQKCSSNCDSQLCNSVTGNCLACPPGRLGNFCETVGPKSLQIHSIPSHLSYINLCPGTRQALTVSCNVPVSDISPEPRFRIFVNDKLMTRELESGVLEGSNYNYTFSWTPFTGGNVTVMCHAENSAYSSMFQNKNLSFEVRAAPQSRPVICINGHRFSNGDLNTVNLSEGDNLEAMCLVEGGYPLISNITLTCANYTITEQGTSVSLENILVHRNWTGQSCVCTVVHQSGCYLENMREVSFSINYHLRQVQAHLGNATVFKICPGRTATIQVYCDVPVADVNPYPLFRGYINNQPVSMELMPGELEEGVYRYTLFANPATGGNYSVTCHAQNSANNSMTSESQLHFYLEEPPENSPVMQINQQTFTGEGNDSNTMALDEGQNITTSCHILGGYPDTAQLVLTCGDSTIITDGNETSLETMTVNRNWTDQSCVCTSQHISGCYTNNVTSVTFHINYHLRSLGIYLTEVSSVVCSESKYGVSVVCDVPVTDVHPSPPLFRVSVNNEPLTGQLNTGILVGNVYRYTEWWNPSVRGNVTIKCSAANSANLSLILDKELQFYIKEPPELPPMIKINNRIFNGSESNLMTLTDGDRFTVTCLVEGGYPPVDNVSLVCGNYTVTELGQMVSLDNIKVTRDWISQECTCTAQHASGRYLQNKTTVQWILLYGPEFVKVDPGVPEGTYVALCANATSTLEVKCDVAVADVNPKPLFQVFINNLPMSSGPEAGMLLLENVHRYVYFWTPSFGGNFTVTCYAENSANSSLFTIDDANVYIIEPPNNAPTIEINGQRFNNKNLDTAILRDGHNVTATCQVLGGYPLVTAISLLCGDVTSSEEGNIVFLEKVLVNRSWSGQACVCYAQHQSQCYHYNNKTVTLNITYGPDSVQFTRENITSESLTLCDGKATPVTLFCEVPEKDVSFEPVFVISVDNQSVITSPEFGALSNGSYRFIHRWTPTMSGENSLACRALNPDDVTMFKETQLILAILEPPNMAPLLRVESSWNVSENPSITLVSEGDKITITCSVSGGYPHVTHVSLDCGDNQTAELGNSVSLKNFPINRTWTGQTCVCTAQHPSGCNFENQQRFQFNVIYGPKSVDFHVNGSVDKDFTVCPDKSEVLTVFCEVPVAKVNPLPVFHVYHLSNQSKTQEMTTGMLVGDVYRYTYSLTLKEGGNLTLVCRAENSLNKSMLASKELTFFIQQPPKSRPTLQINDEIMYDDEVSVKNLTMTDSLNITCWLEGGSPPVIGINLTCGDRSTFAEGTTARLENIVFAGSSAWSCVCSARHVSGCYKGVKRVTAVYMAETNQPGHLGLGLGLGFSFLIVVIVLAVVNVYWRAGKNQESHSRKVSTESTSNPVYNETIDEVIDDTPLVQVS